MSFDRRNRTERVPRGRPRPLRPPPPRNRVTFERRELDRILRLYGRKVAAGEWRDYAIDFLKDRAVFSVFRRASEVPIYRIEKNPKLARRQGAYSVISATGLIMRRGHELDRVLRVLDKSLRLVAVSDSAASQGYACAPRRRPSARCISTLSSQRPNLKPTLLERADRPKAERAVQLDRGGLLRESPITAIICRKPRASACVDQRASSARPMPRRCACGWT